ncbi:MAG: cell division protein [Betaproteobacteria bacterium]|nr:cell division protein [Betaproteobacteria bacterium]
MTELQISLIVIGAVIIVGVIIYNKWQEYRAHKKVERAFADAPDDVLMQSALADDDDIRREPVFFQHTVAGVKLEDPAMHASVSITGLSHSRNEGLDEDTETGYAQDIDETDEIEVQISTEVVREPYIEVSIAGSESVDSLERPLARGLPVDDLIDYPILLNLEEPVRAEKMLPLIQSLRYTGNKPVHFVGLARDGETGKESWQPIVHGSVYYQLKAGVQLANRAGALNEIEYSELISRLRQIADGIGAETEVPDMTDVLKAARELYQFVAEHDARLGINVRTNGAPWSAKTVMAVLERQKLDLRPDGFFVMHDTDGSVLFSLTVNTSSASEMATHLTLLLDVPCVAQEKNGFGVMVQYAKSLCQRLDGILVDDDDRMLSDPMLNDIIGQVNVFYEEMKAVSIPAGSLRAMRLFN